MRIQPIPSPLPALLAAALFFVGLGTGMSTLAQEGPVTSSAESSVVGTIEEQTAAIRTVLQRTQPHLEIVEITPSRVEGLYEISIQNGQMLYASADARYFLAGDLYAVQPQGLVNVGELERNAWRAERIAEVEEAGMISYPAEGEERAELHVFTDVDCPYCRQLHAEVPQLNAMGITVHYLAFPRTGLDTDTHRKMISAWCADDPQVMLTSAKRGAELPPRSCDNPIAEHYQLGREVGVTGTPALVLRDGSLLPGYVPAEELAPYLLDNP